MISVILSTNNEIRNGYLEDMLEAISSQKSDHEIIVVDNGSTDGTIEVVEKYTDKIFSLLESNRAQRLNLWLQKAEWDIILFHHSVAKIQWDSFATIEKVLRDNDWGWHTHSFDLENPILRFTSWYSNNMRWKRGILYLDHCIFANKTLLDELGGFPDMDIFEDTAFSEKMRKKSCPIIIDEKIVTSARRFTKRGIIKQSFLNQWLKLCYYAKLSDKKMNKSYEQDDGFNVTYK